MRFIPSCEWQTGSGNAPAVVAVIHPLLRGANRFHTTGEQQWSDSSPHTRGKQTSQPISGCYLCDSSPPTRGTLYIPETSRWWHRFIPSCEWADIQRTPNEPRQHDLSPPTRGKRGGIKMLKTFCPIHPLLREANVFRRDSLGVIVRFIPSYEGQTWTVYFLSRRWPKNPLPRGANVAPSFFMSETAESSPLARGKQPDFFFSCVCRRFIPLLRGANQCTNSQ